MGDLRARLAHTGLHVPVFASDCYPEPVGTDPVTESTVGVFVLDVWMGER